MIGLIKTLPTLAIALLTLIAGCGDDTAIQPVGGSPKEIRLARDQLALEQRIARLEASGHGEELLRSGKELLDDRPKRSWFELDGWTLGRHELLFLQQMNTPSSEDGTGPIHALDFEVENHPLHVIAEYSRELAERGIDLLVVPVPNRAQVQSDLLPNVSRPEGCLGGDLAMPRLMLEMSRAGIEVIDLYPAFAAARVKDLAGGDPRSLFLDHNPHWSPRGVRVGAEVIAERIRALDWYEPGPAAMGVNFDVKEERLAFEGVQHGDETRDPPELMFHSVINRDGTPSHRRDRKSPILLLGDSYAGYYGKEGSSVASHLYAMLGHTVDFINVQQGAENTVWQAVARRGDDLKGKKVVVWLFSRSVLASREMQKVEIFRD